MNDNENADAEPFEVPVRHQIAKAMLAAGAGLFARALVERQYDNWLAKQNEIEDTTEQ